LVSKLYYNIIFTKSIGCKHFIIKMIDKDINKCVNNEINILKNNRQEENSVVIYKKKVKINLEGVK